MCETTVKCTETEGQLSVANLNINCPGVFSYDFFCTALVQLVGNTYKTSQNKMMRPFEAILRTEWKRKTNSNFP